MHDALCETGVAMWTETSAHYVIIVRFVQETVFSKYSAGTQCHVSGVATWDEYPYLFSSKADICLPCSLHLFRGRNLHRSRATVFPTTFLMGSIPRELPLQLHAKAHADSPCTKIRLLTSAEWKCLSLLLFHLSVLGILHTCRFFFVLGKTLVLQWHCSSLQ